MPPSRDYLGRGNPIMFRGESSVNYMTFHAGPWAYTAVVSGDNTYAEFETRTIYFSERMPPSERIEWLAHEMVHVWCWHVPFPRTEEELASLTATVLEQLRQDLAAQGGEQALRNLAKTPPPREMRLVIDEWSQVA